MKFPIVVSFYTENTWYQIEAHDLVASCARWGLTYDVVGIPSKGSWELNCAYKPFFIYEMLQKWKQPVFWIDADAVFVQEPTYLDVFVSDVAARFQTELGPFHDSYLLSGSLFVNYTPGGVQAMHLWAQECLKELQNPERIQEFWDQITLNQVLNRLSIKVGSLPSSYAKIVGSSSDDLNVPSGVIQHHQASRRYKRMNNNNL